MSRDPAADLLVHTDMLQIVTHFRALLVLLEDI